MENQHFPMVFPRLYQPPAAVDAGLGAAQAAVDIQPPQSLEMVTERRTRWIWNRYGMYMVYGIWYMVYNIWYMDVL